MRYSVPSSDKISPVRARAMTVTSFVHPASFVIDPHRPIVVFPSRHGKRDSISIPTSCANPGKSGKSGIIRHAQVRAGRLVTSPALRPRMADLLHPMANDLSACGLDSSEPGREEGSIGSCHRSSFREGHPGPQPHRPAGLPPPHFPICARLGMAGSAAFPVRSGSDSEGAGIVDEG